MIFPVAGFSCQENKKCKDLVNKMRDFYSPFLIKCPSVFIKPIFFMDSLLTDSFSANLSNLSSSVIVASCWSVNDLLKKAATFSISPRKFYFCKITVKL